MEAHHTAKVPWVGFDSLPAMVKALDSTGVVTPDRLESNVRLTIVDNCWEYGKVAHLAVRSPVFAFNDNDGVEHRGIVDEEHFCFIVSDISVGILSYKEVISRTQEAILLSVDLVQPYHVPLLRSL
jgi:hypothetical protein